MPDMRQIQHWIDGELTIGTSDRVGAVYNPATGEQTGEVVLGSDADVDRAVQTARAAFETWRFSSLPPRGCSPGARSLRDSRRARASSPTATSATETSTTT